METQNGRAGNCVPWNKGKLTGQKPPLKLPEIWAIRTRLQMSSNVRDLAMFNLAIDSKLFSESQTRPVPARRGGQRSGFRLRGAARVAADTLPVSRNPTLAFRLPGYLERIVDLNAGMPGRRFRHSASPLMQRSQSTQTDPSMLPFPAPHKRFSQRWQPACPCQAEGATAGQTHRRA